MANQPYETSAMYQPKVGRMQPDPQLVAEAVERLAAAKRPIILGGRGVLWSGARDAVVKLADRCGALLSNTLPARGLFHDHPFGLGTTGSYFTSLGREMYESADVVLAVGTSLSYYVGGGHYWGKAVKIQLDDAPRGLRDGQKAADIYVRSDALVGVEAILAGLDKKLGVGKPTAAAIRSKELAHRIATEPAELHAIRHRARGTGSTRGDRGHRRGRSEGLGLCRRRRPSGLFQHPDAWPAGGALHHGP